MKRQFLATGFALMLGACGMGEAHGGGPAVDAASEVAAGEYLTTIAACNDCHKLGWMERGEAVPVGDRLTGTPIGWRGPWGTSYPANLRLTAANMTSDQWVTMIRARNGNPPMPWMNVHGMSDRDLGAILAYLRSLGPKGDAVPAFVPPDREPSTRSSCWCLRMHVRPRRSRPHPHRQQAEVRDAPGEGTWFGRGR